MSLIVPVESRLQNSIMSSHSLSLFTPLQAFLTTFLSFLSLPYARATETNLNERDITHFCNMLGQKTGLKNLKAYRSFERGDKLIHCSYVSEDENAQVTPTKNYKALIRNVEGKDVKSHEELTIGQVAKEGMYTFGFPADTRVERTIFCGKASNPYSCNKFIRTAQETPKGSTVAESKGWTLQQVMTYLSDLAETEEYDMKTMGIKVQANEKGFQQLNQTSPLPSYIQVEQRD